MLLRLRAHYFLPEKDSVHPASGIAFEMHFNVLRCIAQRYTTLLD